MENLNIDMNDPTKKKHIVVDCDEVLCNISPKWTYLIHQEKDYFGKYMNLIDNFDIDLHYNMVLSRNKFYLNQWLIKDESYTNYSEDEMDEVLRRMMMLYETEDYYDNLKPNPIVESLALSIRQPILDRISIVTRTNAKNLKSKERFLKNCFQGVMNKVDIYFVENDENKSDIIKDLGDGIAAIYEDEVKNIVDILDNCNNLDKSLIYVPSYGYNNANLDLYTKAEEKGTQLRYYSY
ncbi:hypothetical protein FPHOBKDP_00124 [Listeria phage LPJP1]|nr:hypothetical protein FPHOBKDP_00124 [Listeria phage LPJP1]